MTPTERDAHLGRHREKIENVMKDIKIDIDLLKNPDEWHAEWHRQRNAGVAALANDGREGRLWAAGKDLSRGDFDDEQVRWLFWRQFKPDSERCPSDRSSSPDAYLYEGITACMQRARDDERKRLARGIVTGLQALLGPDAYDAVAAEMQWDDD